MNSQKARIVLIFFFLDIVRQFDNLDKPAENWSNPFCIFF
jgi:hypothetical protein